MAPAESQNFDKESTLKNPTDNVGTNEGKESVTKNEPEKDLISWIAPARPFKRRDKEYYIAAIIGLVLFLVEGFMPVILVISIVFLFYVMNTVEPENIEYKVTNRGIKVADKRSDWEILNRYWFTKRFDTQLLIIESLNFPGRLEVVINEEIKEQLKKFLNEYIKEEEIPPSFLDKAANWFSKKLPGNK
jgi:hypothetical protein